MDRFIDNGSDYIFCSDENLKSNMDRFIALPSGPDYPRLKI